VLSRFGDVFGPTVNLAARLTDIAEPSTVLVDVETAHALANDPGVVLEPLEPVELHGLGLVQPVRLSAAR
jgi:adenylate cyclase